MSDPRWRRGLPAATRSPLLRTDAEGRRGRGRTGRVPADHALVAWDRTSAATETAPPPPLKPHAPPRERPPHPQRGTAPNRPTAPPRDRAAQLPPYSILARRGLARGALNARRIFNNGAHAATHSPPLLPWRRATRAGRRGRGGQRTATKGTAHQTRPTAEKEQSATKGGGSTPPPRAHLAREALNIRGGYRRERRLSIAQISKSRM